MVWRKCTAYFYRHGQIDQIPHFPVFLMGTSMVIMVQKWYRVIRQRISDSMHFGNLEWKFAVLIVCFRSRKEVSWSIGDGKCAWSVPMKTHLWGRLVMIFLWTPSAIWKWIKCSHMQYSGRLFVIKSKGDCFVYTAVQGFQFRVQFFSGIWQGKYNIRPPVHPARQAPSRKKAFYVNILGADVEETAFLNSIGKAL